MCLEIRFFDLNKTLWLPRISINIIFYKRQRITRGFVSFRLTKYQGKEPKKWDPAKKKFC